MDRKVCDENGSDPSGAQTCAELAYVVDWKEKETFQFSTAQFYHTAGVWNPPLL
jgi:hypothetical protein